MWGYLSFTEFIKTWFRNVDSLIIQKYLIPLLLIINTFFEWIFISVGGIYFLMVLYIIDFITGVGRSIYFSLKIKEYKTKSLSVPSIYVDKKLVSKKFPRFLLTLLSTIVLLALIKFAGIYSVIFYPLYSIFYSVFLGQQLISIVENLNDMGLLGKTIYNSLKRKITDIID